MKFFKYIFFIVFVSGIGRVMAVEEAEYSVLTKDDNIELREYAPHIVAETVIYGDFEDAGGMAFRPLFNYISGQNAAQQKIAMTAPVAQQAQGEKIAMTAPVGQRKERDGWAVSFMMPSSYSMETLPVPLNSDVTLREVPSRLVVALRYSGLWRDNSYQQHKATLTKWINEQNLTVAGEAIWARYDPPYVPWFMRRNEILIPVSKGES
jgi:effector-binding domain-containing protein